jgi:error-prone DNA polymerase
MRLAKLHPAELLAETLRVAERCTFSLDELRYEYPEEIVPSDETPSTYLRKLVLEGLQRRFGNGEKREEGRGKSKTEHSTVDIESVERGASAPHSSPFPLPSSRFSVPQKVLEQIEHELRLIEDLKYEPYFLTVHDIVAFARDRGILCQGRGSAANSAVCYALGITEVDPARMSMLFERFISKERNEPPDIDVDFEHQRREEVIQYLYAKYGRDRAALAATVITYRPKSAVRDAGKALGLDPAQVDRLAKNMAWWDGRRALPERIRETGLDPDSLPVKQLLELVSVLIGFPRHLSQHTGGFVIARGLLTRLVPVENAAMPERSVIQWDKDDLDALGLLKVDVLALGMLSAIRRALDLVNGCRGTRLRMQDIPPEDPAVYAMISRADTVGVFQIESRAQMSMLPRLRPRCFFDLVIEVAIVRPGPIQGGMVHPYLRRRAGLEPVSYPSEEVRGVLERTLGVPVFQEQVMALAMVAAGFTAGEADRLRRAMAAWRRKGGLEPFEERLKTGMRSRGYPDAFADALFRQILGFGEYGFPESHAASFALLVYVSAWLKHHEPAAFCAALLNSQPMGFYAPSQLVQDARRHGVEVLPVDVCASGYECSLEAGKREEGRGKSKTGEIATDVEMVESGAPAPHSSLFPLPSSRFSEKPALRLGLRMIKGLPEASAHRIVAARAQGELKNIQDLARRANLDARDLKALAAAGALASLADHRRLAYWDVAGVETRPHLLRDAPVAEARPALAAPSEGEDLVADYASLGLTLGRHPLALLRPRLARMRLLSAEEVRALPHGRPARASGIVTTRQRPGTASGVVFVTLEDETGCVNVVIWGRLFEAQRREALGARLMTVHGTVEREGEVVHLVAARLIDHTALLGRLATGSRDFH